MARMTGLAKAAKSGDRLALLREMRTHLVDAIDEATCVRDLEPLARRLDVVSAAIEDPSAIREPTGSPADILRERREARIRRGEPVAVEHPVGRMAGRRESSG